MTIHTDHLAIAVHATALDRATAGAGGVWLKLLPAGSAQMRDGRGPYHVGDRAAMQEIVDATIARAGATELMVDYDHQSEFAAVPGVGGRAPAAGWIKQMEVRDDGIWGQVEWTEAARAAITASEYRYLSPTFLYKQGRVLCLVSAGLTNTPAFDLAAAIAARALRHTLTDDEDSMKKIAKALGLAEDASEDQILAAVAGREGTLKAVASAVGVTASGDALVTAVQSAVKAGAPDPAKYAPVEQLVAVQASLKTLQDTLAADKATAAVDAAIAAGKIAPATKDWALDYARTSPDGFDKFVAAAPVIVSTAATVKNKLDPSGADLTDTDLTVARAMGLDPEKVKAQRKKETC